MTAKTGLLGNLVEAIETLRRRIAEHGHDIAQDETRTRQTLVDPLLFALGWDASNPAQVTLEYKKGRGRADYALLGPDSPLAIIEAKRLREQLDDKHIEQALNYANTEDIDFIVVTNGDEWKMYGVFLRGTMNERLLMHLKISATPVHETVLESLRLWNANLGTGKPAPAGKPVVTDISDDDVLTADDIVFDPGKNDSDSGADAGKRKRAHTPVQPRTEPHHDGWMPINDVELAGALRGKNKQRIVLDIGGTQKTVKSQTDILATVITVALVDSGKLTRADCPVLLGGSKTRYLINTKPTHADNTPFVSARALSGGLHLFTAHAVSAMLKHLCRLLEEFDIDLATVRVRVEDA